MNEEENKVVEAEEADKYEKQKKTIHTIGTIAHIAFPIGLWCTIGFLLTGITFNIVAALAFADGSTGAKIFYHFAEGAYSVLGSFAIPALIGAIVLRIILKKKKAENPYFKDSVDDFNVY